MLPEVPKQCDNSPLPRKPRTTTVDMGRGTAAGRGLRQLRPRPDQALRRARTMVLKLEEVAMSNQQAQTIVVGIDSSPPSQKALAWALDEARRRATRCHVVHAWEYPSMALATPYVLVASLERYRDDERDWLRSALDQADLNGV